MRDRNDFELKLFQNEIQNSIYHNKGKVLLSIIFFHSINLKISVFSKRRMRKAFGMHQLSTAI